MSKTTKRQIFMNSVQMIENTFCVKIWNKSVSIESNEVVGSDLKNQKFSK